MDQLVHRRPAFHQKCQKQHVNASPMMRKWNNPLQAGIMDFLVQKSQKITLQAGDVPKRYTRYGSLLLLGPTFFTHSPLWTELLSTLTNTDSAELFSHIIHAFKDDELTHIAINAPIAATKPGRDGLENNLLRSPTGLQLVYGNFGPGTDQCDEQCPDQEDLDAAYWTHTVQLSDIVQVWAPRWTMFSRGNLSEKARILQANHSNSPFPGLDEVELEQEIGQIDVVDFYIGIGYFAFSYLSRGVARVWGWDINGWSVEGLRRGCLENGWGVRVIQIDELGRLGGGQCIGSIVRDVLRLECTSDAIRCIVFCGNNTWACRYLAEAKAAMEAAGKHNMLNIRHCNLGLLPTSQDSWEGAVQVLDPDRGGWLHIHENVESSSVETKAYEIVQQIQVIAQRNGKSNWQALCCHVERVKTYAPGVVHCVFDVKLYPS